MREETVTPFDSPVKMVGAARFELATSCTPSKRASRATLRPEPFRRIAPAERALCRRERDETILKSLPHPRLRLPPINDSAMGKAPADPERQQQPQPDAQR